MRTISRLLLMIPIAFFLNCVRSLEPVLTLSVENTTVVLSAAGGRFKSGSNPIELRFEAGGVSQAVEAPSVLLYMPAMGTMPEMRTTAQLEPAGQGLFKGRIDLEMTGKWQGLLEFTDGSEKKRADFSIQVQ